jgi:hypothetical protein
VIRLISITDSGPRMALPHRAQHFAGPGRRAGAAGASLVFVGVAVFMAVGSSTGLVA